MIFWLVKLYEGPGEGETNTYNVDITEEMSPKDVLANVLGVLEKNCQQNTNWQSLIKPYAIGPQKFGPLTIGLHRIGLIISR